MNVSRLLPAQPYQSLTSLAKSLPQWHCVAKIAWHPALNCERLHALLTPISRCFSTFHHCTCLLSVYQFVLRLGSNLPPLFILHSQRVLLLIDANYGLIPAVLPTPLLPSLPSRLPSVTCGEQGYYLLWRCHSKQTFTHHMINHNESAIDKSHIDKFDLPSRHSLTLLHSPLL